MKLSAVIIAKNSAELIKECIDSVKFCDEIIVVDGQSTDNTVEVAKSLGVIVVEGSPNDFSKQRMIGLEKAKGDWVLYVDTDERVSPELAKEIQKKSTYFDSRVSVYKVQRKNFYLGNHAWPKIEKLERLFRKKDLTSWYGKLHESPEFTGLAADLDGYLLHYTHRDLFSMLVKTNQWSEVEAKLRIDAHHPPVVWWRFFRVFLTGFFDSYIKQGGWKVGTAGLIESIYQGFSMFVTYAKLWELQQNSQKFQGND
jgi:glycosyltransferase involved in cell wall biosynthesis